MTSLPILRTFGLPGIRQRTPQSHGHSPVYLTDLGLLRLLGVWHGLCSSPCIVLSRTGKLSAIALIVAVVTTTGSTLIAQGAQHEACATKHHECDPTPRIVQCCCGHASDASSQGGPVESRVQLTAHLSPLPVALAAGTFADTSGMSLQVHTSPPSIYPPDLATRFAPLLI
jgi:hypothetical protein